MAARQRQVAVTPHDAAEAALVAMFGDAGTLSSQHRSTILPIIVALRAADGLTLLSKIESSLRLFQVRARLQEIEAELDSNERARPHSKRFAVFLAEVYGPEAQKRNDQLQRLSNWFIWQGELPFYQRLLDRSQDQKDYRSLTIASFAELSPRIPAICRSFHQQARIEDEILRYLAVRPSQKLRAVLAKDFDAKLSNSHIGLTELAAVTELVRSDSSSSAAAAATAATSAAASSSPAKETHYIQPRSSSVVVGAPSALGEAATSSGRHTRANTSTTAANSTSSNERSGTANPMRAAAPPKHRPPVGADATASKSLCRRKWLREGEPSSSEEEEQEGSESASNSKRQPRPVERLECKQNQQSEESVSKCAKSKHARTTLKMEEPKEGTSLIAAAQNPPRLSTKHAPTRVHASISSPVHTLTAASSSSSPQSSSSVTRNRTLDNHLHGTKSIDTPLAGASNSTLDVSPAATREVETATTSQQSARLDTRAALPIPSSQVASVTALVSHTEQPPEVEADSQSVSSQPRTEEQHDRDTGSAESQRDGSAANEERKEANAAAASEASRGVLAMYTTISREYRAELIARLQLECPLTTALDVFNNLQSADTGPLAVDELAAVLVSEGDMTEKQAERVLHPCKERFPRALKQQRQEETRQSVYNSLLEKYQASKTAPLSMKRQMDNLKALLEAAILSQQGATIPSQLRHRLPLTPASTQRCRRLLIRDLVDFLPTSSLEAPLIYAAPEADSSTLLRWRAVLCGPPESNWQHVTVQLQIDFPEKYPVDWPSVRCVPPIFHPNVDIKTGIVCADIFSVDKWSPSYRLQSLLMSLQALLDTPNVSSPLNKTAADLYNQQPRDEYWSRVFSTHVEAAFQHRLKAAAAPGAGAGQQ